MEMQRVRSTVLVTMLLTAAVPLSAHVTLQPKTAKTGMQEYSVRVPTEKDVATTSVRMVFPPGFEVLRFRPPAPGWTYEIERDSSGRISGVTWSGGKIARDEYEQFQFMARARNAGVFKIDAYQTYGDNDVDEINRAPAKTQSALLEAMQETQVTIEGAAGAEGATAAVTAGPSTWMGGAAVAIALAALVMSMRSARRVR